MNHKGCFCNILWRLGIHRLAARVLIQSLETEEREKREEHVRKKIVDLSVQAGVSSSFTAFLVVHKSSGQPVKRPLVRRTVSLGWSSGMHYWIGTVVLDKSWQQNHDNPQFLMMTNMMVVTNGTKLMYTKSCVIACAKGISNPYILPHL